jgi:hypothetical protein
MKNLKTSLRTLAVAVAFVLGLSAFAEAQATRTWVSGVGDDVNPCSRTAPCKTFAGAISKTATNGEINCLDPAGYGAVTVTKSITIDCEDTQGSILAAGTNGVIVNITSAADAKKAFKIRGVSINGAGTGINGIRILAANTVVVDEAIIDGFTQHGISIETTTGTPKISVDASGIRSNAGNGINSFVSGGSVTLAVSNSRINNTATGVNLSNNTNATVFSSTVSGNTTGLLAFNATLGVIGSNISHNTTGITASTSGTVRISGNQITNNGTGLSVSGGSLISYSSNMLDGNTVDGSPTSTILLQ